MASCVPFQSQSRGMAKPKYLAKYQYKYGHPKESRNEVAVSSPSAELSETLSRQGIVILGGFVTMVSGLFAVYVYGAANAPEPKHHPAYALAEYLLPVLAAVIAGGGFYARYPGLRAKHSKEKGPNDQDARAYFAVSLVFLWLGVASYAYDHACSLPSVAVVGASYVAVATVVLLIRTNTPDRSSDWPWKLAVGLMVIVALAALITLAFIFPKLFEGHVCSD